jgi:hypothetical protein
MENFGPGPCARCRRDKVDANRLAYGCGWDEDAAGTSTVEFIDSQARQKNEYDEWLPHDEQPPEYRTCPWYFASQPFVHSIYELLDEYEAGALGSIFDLPAPLVTYLRVASTARSAYLAKQKAAAWDAPTA